MTHVMLVQRLLRHVGLVQIAEGNKSTGVRGRRSVLFVGISVALMLECLEAACAGLSIFTVLTTSISFEFQYT